MTNAHLKFNIYHSENHVVHLKVNAIYTLNDKYNC